ncbi:universal stress protein [Modestobacter sp. VKM Ac-2978]|uniref:universal stress protein n=1 Tax=Modestobacter sp. VKM Ac-2978 TaxID=3004132 RepID=UPI0022AA79DB|nr:universal stress protein [Modestobacter sp. VKM Ac-2978]MCZ2848605.1 universal stress protein [Modestobacter sp. VKM Ac-2978]
MVYDEEADLYVGAAPAEPEVMHGRRVVAAVDGSGGSKAALRFALEDAARRGVPVEAVIAYRLPELWVDYDGIGSPEERRLHDTLRSQSEDKVRTAIDEAARDFDGPLPDVEVRAALGPPAEALIRESDGADLLVVGSRGHGGFHTMLLGSTSMQCAMHAACPVTVVHSPEAHSHRLRLHRERQEQRPSEGRGRVDAPD